MKEKEIVINEKTYKVRELKYVDTVSLQDMEKAEMARHMLKHSINLTDEEIDELSFKEGLELQKVINEINGLDFQEPVVKTN